MLPQQSCKQNREKALELLDQIKTELKDYEDAEDWDSNYHLEKTKEKLQEALRQLTGF